MSFTFTKSQENYSLGTISEFVIMVCVVMYMYYTFYEGFEGMNGNPYAARLVQCASDGYPGTQAGANCWGQVGPQGCPEGLPPCEDPNEQFLGSGHTSPPVFYNMGNERAVAKATRASSNNNSLNNSSANNNNMEEFGLTDEDKVTTGFSTASPEPFVESYINY